MGTTYDHLQESFPSETQPYQDKKTSLAPILTTIVFVAIVSSASTAYLYQGKLKNLENQITSLQEQKIEPNTNTDQLLQGSEANVNLLLSNYSADEIQAPTIAPTKLAPEQYYLNTQQQNDLLTASHISGLSPHTGLGRMFLAVDWSIPAADNGRKIVFGFEGTKNWGSRWGGLTLEYSTYDFAIGSEYRTYATAQDYQKVVSQDLNNVTVNGIKGTVTYRLNTDYDANQIEKVVVFPFKNYYIAGVYKFKETNLPNSEQIIEDLRKSIYPKSEKAYIQMFDSLINSVAFADKQ